MSTPHPPELEYVASMAGGVGSPIDLGVLPGGHQRLIPLHGGRVEGPLLSGRVLAGGFDHQRLHTETLMELDATYPIETDDGAYILVHSIGIRVGSAADMAAIARDEPVDPSQIYTRGQPRLSSADPRWKWVNERLFLAVGVRRPTGVEIQLFMVR